MCNMLLFVTITYANIKGKVLLVTRVDNIKMNTREIKC
jgi:hypothetical protein